MESFDEMIDRVIPPYFERARIYQVLDKHGYGMRICLMPEPFEGIFACVERIPLKDGSEFLASAIFGSLGWLMGCRIRATHCNAVTVETTDNTITRMIESSQISGSSYLIEPTKFVIQYQGHKGYEHGSNWYIFEIKEGVAI